MRIGPLRRPRVIVALAVLIALGVVLGPRLYVGDLEEALVRQANEIVAAPRSRPVHRDQARPGTFADALRVPLPRYEEAWKAIVDMDGATASISAIAKGERPLSELPPAIASRLAALNENLDAVLQASRAERADLGPDHDPWGPLKGASWLGVQGAARHAAIRIRTELASSPERALSECVDGLALGRDAAISGGLIGRMIRDAMVTVLVPACGEAVFTSKLSAAREARAQLRRIQDAAPTFGAMVREEAVQVQLLAYGPRLSPGMKSRLSARPLVFAEDGSMATPGVLGPLLQRLVWRDLVNYQNRLVAASMRPPEERQAAFAAVGPVPWLQRTLVGDARTPDMTETFARFSRRDVAASSQLDLLLAAVAVREFQVNRGEWPSAVFSLEAAGGLTPEEARRLQHLTMQVEAGGTLRLALSVPQADAAVPGEAVIRVHRAGEARSP